MMRLASTQRVAFVYRYTLPDGYGATWGHDRADALRRIGKRTAKRLTGMRRCEPVERHTCYDDCERRQA